MAGARERDVAAAVAAELRAIIARKQMKNVHLAKAAGIPNSTLASILSGAGAIDVDQLARICRHLDVEPGDVLAAALDSLRATTAPPVTRLTRSDVEGLLAKPTSDATLNAQLSEARSVSGVTGDELTQLLERIEGLRRVELLRLLGDLDQAKGRNHNHGA